MYMHIMIFYREKGGAKLRAGYRQWINGVSSNDVIKDILVALCLFYCGLDATTTIPLLLLRCYSSTNIINGA